MSKQRGQIVTDKILDTAERLFFEQGYHITGINQVIAEADIAKASLYNHFESKADLLVAYLQRFHEHWFARLEADVNQVADPKGKLLAIFDHHSGRQMRGKYGGCRFVKANNEAGMSEGRVLAEIQKAKQHFKDFIAQLVVNSGHQQLLTDEELTELVYLMMEGGILAASIFKQADDLKAAKAIIQKLL